MVRVRHVLFVYTHNAGRSQMARAFFERDAPPDVRAESAGTDPGPEIWPEVVETMAEVGIDIAGRRPRRLDLEVQLHADWAGDRIERDVRRFIDDRLPEIYADRTAHELRLARLLPNLAREFDGVRSPEEIRACADAVLADYDDAPVRGFVFALADRRTRECPRAESCDVLAG